MTGYTGPGFTGTIPAIKQIAAALHPERWAPEAMSDEEKAIWHSLGISARGDLFEQQILIELKQRDEITVHRVVDFKEAIALLRDELVADRIQVFFRDDSGKLGLPIAPETWATDFGPAALSHGSAWLDVGEYEVCRFLLLKEENFATWLASLTTTAPSGEPSTSPAAEPTGPKAPRGAARRPRPLGVRAGVMAALQRLYSDDPRSAGTSREEMHRKVEEAIGTKFGVRTLDRALESLWPQR